MQNSYTSRFIALILANIVLLKDIKERSQPRAFWYLNSWQYTPISAQNYTRLLLTILCFGITVAFMWLLIVGKLYFSFAHVADSCG